MVQRRSFLREEWTVVEALQENLFKFAMAVQLVQVTQLWLIPRKEALMRVVWTVEVVQWDLVQHSASYNKWPRWHQDTQRSRSPESSVGSMQEVPSIGFYN